MLYKRTEGSTTRGMESTKEWQSVYTPDGVFNDDYLTYDEVLAQGHQVDQKPLKIRRTDTMRAVYDFDGNCVDYEKFR